MSPQAEHREFTWIPYYRELAQRLLSYRSRQVELISFLESLRGKGLKITPLEDQDGSDRRFLLREIDPFTFFGCFNRGVTKDNRVAILREVGVFLGHDGPAPRDFTGIPILNNQNSWFISFESHRKSTDVEALWAVFSLAQSDNPLDDPKFAAAFDAALAVRGTSNNLTIGLFWIRPDMFLALDSRMRAYLGGAFQTADLSWRSYRELLDQVRVAKPQPFHELSQAAWLNTSAAEHPDESMNYPAPDQATEDAGAATDFLRTLGDEINRVPDRSATDSSKWKTCESLVAKYLGIDAERVVVAYASESKHVKNRLRQRHGSATLRLLLVSDPGTADTAKRLLEEYHTEQESTDAEAILLLAEHNRVWRPIRLVAIGEGVPAWMPQLAAACGLILADDARSVDDVAGELNVSGVWLRSVLDLLEDKKGVVFYGPPGTGKTYIAQFIAQIVQPREELRRIVQLHPSYGYEDFFEGYRPVSSPEGGSTGTVLALRAGPLRELASKLVSSEEKGVLILDEMNRGNLPRVFGELYFMLEYRDKAVRLMYSPQEEFRLPEGLRILGTMNTADRSVALLDQALRRRFHFVSLFPDSEPVKGMLRRYLTKEYGRRLDWLADALDRANTMLDRNVAIGPSHFMRPDLDEKKIAMIWKHSVLPTIEEQFFGQPDRLAGFDLERLRAGPSDALPNPAS